MKVAVGGAVQGVSTLEAAMELIKYIGTCTSLQLRGIVTEHAEPRVSVKSDKSTRPDKKANDKHNSVTHDPCGSYTQPLVRFL